MTSSTLVKNANARRSLIAIKLVMAVSGLIFVGFVLTHMYGNLKAFAGHDAFNNYAEHLRELGEPMLPHGGALWLIRIVLIVSLLLHVGAALYLARKAGQARTNKYVVKKNLASTLSSRTMRWGGLTILIFLVWHLINFTIGKVNVKGGATNDPYRLLVDTFSTPWMTLIYLLAMAALFMHLRHGLFSAMQTLGLTGTEAKRKQARLAGLALGTIIAGGFSLVPLAVLFGLVK